MSERSSADHGGAHGNGFGHRRYADGTARPWRVWFGVAGAMGAPNVAKTYKIVR